MVDLILNFNWETASNNEVTSFEDKVIATGNARYIFLFAKYIKNADIKKLTEAIIKTDNKRYIHIFIASIPNLSYDKLIQKILEFEDADLLYYVAYDTIHLPEEYILMLAKELYRLKNVKRLQMLFYYYFVILGLTNDEMFNLFKKLCQENNIDISTKTVINCIPILEKIKEKLSQDYILESNEEYTKNCATGRKEWIPDMIVCHITSDYRKGIVTFYDEKSEVSSHFIVGRDGQSKQIVQLKDTAWANGTSLNPDSDVYYKFATNNLVKVRNDNANYYSFSIEHESLDGFLTEPQYEKTLEIMKQMITFVNQNYHHKFIIDREHIIGHNEVNPIVRTVCPGPKFPFERFINYLKKWEKENS